MDQLLFLLPHPGGCGRIASTGLLFRCVPDERQRSTGRHLLEASPLRQVSGSEKRRTSIRQPPNPRPHHAAGDRHAYPEEAPPARPPVPRPPQGDTSFSLLDRARPVFSFPSGRKRENGGCNEPAIIMAESPPPARASTTLPLRGRKDPPCLIPQSSSP